MNSKIAPLALTEEMIEAGQEFKLMGAPLHADMLQRMWTAMLSAAPSPDALRVVTPELAAEFANIEGPWTRGQMEMEEVWSRLIDAQLAALQDEQKGGAQ